MQPIVRGATGRVVRVHIDPRLRRHIRHREVIDLACRLVPARVILDRDPGAVSLVPDPLHRIRRPRNIKVRQVWHDGVVRDVRIRERLDLVLHGALEDGDVAVDAGIEGRGLLGVDLPVEGERDVAVVIVFVCAGGIAEGAGRG